MEKKTVILPCKVQEEVIGTYRIWKFEGTLDQKANSLIEEHIKQSGALIQFSNLQIQLNILQVIRMITSPFRTNYIHYIPEKKVFSFFIASQLMPKDLEEMRQRIDYYKKSLAKDLKLKRVFQYRIWNIDPKTHSIIQDIK